MEDKNTNLDLERKLANFRSEGFTADANLRHAAAADAGQSSLKALFLANGGGILALLTILGNTDTPASPNGMWWSFFWFSQGFVASISSQWMHYRSQGFFTSHARYTAAMLANPELADRLHQRADASEKSGKHYRLATLALVYCGILTFIVGSFVALEAVL